MSLAIVQIDRPRLPAHCAAMRDTAGVSIKRDASEHGIVWIGWDEAGMAPDIRQDLIALLPRLRRFARSLTRSATEADDLVQDACLRAIDRSHQWDPAQPLDRWVFRILRNIWISELRKQKVRIGEGQIPAEESTELVSRDSGEGALAATELQAHIAALPTDLSTVFLAVSVEGYSYAEAADLFEIPVGTVMSRIHRARKALAARIGAQGGPEA